MRKISGGDEPFPVKPVAAVLLPAAMDPGEAVFPAVEGLAGRMDYRGQSHPFTLTDYYREEMGSELVRVIVSFASLTSPELLVDFKMDMTGVEEDFSSGGKRRVNIDPGYIDFHKLVLASFKPGPQKIYLSRGVYADPVMYYRDGGFVSSPWTFPDFASGIYHRDLESIREIYRKSCRERRF